MIDGPLYPEPHVAAAGDAALLVEMGEGIDERVNRRVHALDLALRRHAIPGLVDLIPTYRSLLVAYDPRAIDRGRLEGTIAALAAALDESMPAPARTVEVPVCYGGRFGPDLPFVAAHNNLAEPDVVAIHTSGVYRVFMMGFSPGFAYLGGLSPRIAAPRLRTPRTSIPAGSVGIAQQQTGIYPVESPGGWQLVGRSPLRLFDPERTPPTLLAPGDRVQFTSINEARYRELEEAEQRNVGRQAAGGGHTRTPGGDPPPAHRLPPDARLDPCPAPPDPGAVLEVVHAGLFTTVQDLGRYGFQRYGVPVSGAMDAFALRVANLLVGNDENSAALEMTVMGAELRFLRDTVVAVAGADLQPRVDDRAVSTWQAFPVARGAVLSFRGLRAGARAYLAIAGGLDVPLVLGSRSTYVRSRFGGLNGRALEPGDRLSCLPAPPVVETRRMPASWLPTYLGSHRLRVVLGPQAHAFTARGVQTLLSSAYVIGAQSDRMGYRLEGPRIEHRNGADIVSDGMPPGAVQVAGDGMPLVLLADRGTTGGYAKIATIITVDLPRLAQARPGDRVFFDAVEVDEAHEARRRQETLLDEVRNGPRDDMSPGLAPRHRPVAAAREATDRATIAAPLPGRIIQVLVQPGDRVERGQRLCVLEAMKMENPITATRSGRVTAVRVAAGDEVSHGQPLFQIDELEMGDGRWPVG